MIFVKACDLPRIDLLGSERSVSFGSLQQSLEQHFSDIVYIERLGKLYGIVSLGDICEPRMQGARS